MKNISRRMFIKGVAVSAATLAAVSLLTGCNMDDLTPEQVENVLNNLPQTRTITLDGETFTITATGFGFNADGSPAIDFTIVNELGEDVFALTVYSVLEKIMGGDFEIGSLPIAGYLEKQLESGDGTAKLNILACLPKMDDLTLSVATAVAVDWNGLEADNIIPANTDGASYTQNCTLSVPVENLLKAAQDANITLDIDFVENWKKLTLGFTLAKVTVESSGDSDLKVKVTTREVSFDFNR